MINVFISVRFQLETTVMASGNVENWLGDLLNEQQRSLHAVIREASLMVNDSSGFDLMGFLNSYQAQVWPTRV